MKNRYQLFLIILVCVLIGITIGNFVSLRQQDNKGLTGLVSFNKLDALLNLVSSKYVEDVDEKKLIEGLIPQVLLELDPHSIYITAEEMERANEDIEGSFSGVGIQFNIREDTIRVVAVITGGPAEQAGLRAGDMIVSINDSSFVGSTITNERVMKTLRGEKNTDVKVGVRRRNAGRELSFNLTRDDIPVNSIDASYKIGENIAYIKLGKFTRTSYNEFLSVISKMKAQDNCDRVILDLRGNPGGLMGPALAILNEFLPRNSLMLYVEGKAYKREESYSDGRGSCQNTPLIVLMDEWAASSSEIVAGAIQDNDRGYIVGRRSYGKGLVQQQIPFKDGSAIRLTVAHYYVPSGRNIQKPFEKGDFEDYEMDLVNRYMRGEFDSRDSIQLSDSLIYKTKGGRLVYGGGGIMPDFFVPIDTTGSSEWYNTVFNQMLPYNFAASYADHHREQLLDLKTPAALKAYLQEQRVFESFVDYTVAQGIPKNPKQISLSKELAATQIFAYIARNILGEDAFWMLLQEKDATLTKAISLIQNLTASVPVDQAQQAQ
ncbi:MAG: S41 family peptidase [Bacteroidales bacterium]|nr:S41 family peptidase [Bacteroidales bacterium]MDD4361058.1 S41 family peptidase [Bacteroidales bacterium]MDD4430027.1 S41 family peptidase [Bacteroidales bacterium]